MHSRTGSSMSTLMFMVPLLGVPLMAMFGVPQFVPVIASSVNDEVTRPAGIRSKQIVGESASATTMVAESSMQSAGSRDDQPLQDIFRPAERSRRGGRQSMDAESRGLETKFVETSLKAETWLTQNVLEEPASTANQRLVDLFGTYPATANPIEPQNRARSTTARTLDEPKPLRSTANVFEANTDRSNKGLTWREAVRRLNELGIHEFRLEPGSQPGDFYFACEFAPHRDARVTRRFEAEATEPLLAVQVVLRQIDEWLTRR
ncbi:MAG: hypothetical protein FJ302_09345 [Planctomycetes bacterium]|nr:hypothetical protein [Planctomycetota bacterium]